MKIKDLKKIIEEFDENQKVFFFDSEHGKTSLYEEDFQIINNEIIINPDYED